MTTTETTTPVADKKGNGKAPATAKKAPAKKAVAKKAPAKAKAEAPKAEQPKVDRMATSIEGVKLTAAQRKDWLSKVEAHVQGMKPKAKDNYTKLAEAMAATDKATNSWQLEINSTLPGKLDLAEGTLYAAIRDLAKAGLLTVKRIGRSDFYHPTV